MKKLFGIFQFLWDSIKTLFASIADEKSEEKTSQELSQETESKPATSSVANVIPQSPHKPETAVNSPEVILTPVKSESPVNIPVEITKKENKEFAENVSENIPLSNPAKRRTFIKSLSLAVEQGYDPLIPYVHASLETGEFLHIVGDWQFFGLRVPEKIKPPQIGWDGKIAKVITHEWIEKFIADYDKFEYQITKWKTDAVIIGNNTYEKLEDIKRTMFPAPVKFYIKEIVVFCDHTNSDDAIKFYMFQIKRLFSEAWANRSDYIAYAKGLFSGANKYATADAEEYSKYFSKLYEECKKNEKIFV